MMTRQQQDAWIANYGPMAHASQLKTGVPASITLAQAILESSDRKGNWGCSGLALQCNNFFGIKARHLKGVAIEDYKEFLTTEYDAGGKPHAEEADFARFKSVQESFDRHAQLLSTAKRYQPAMDVKNDPLYFATKLRECGYATDPGYPNKLTKLMRDYPDILKFDAPDQPAALKQGDGDPAPLEKTVTA
jgi:flagellum-specific peptidoglycan hydrolase FlgJ